MNADAIFCTLHKCIFKKFGVFLETPLSQWVDIIFSLFIFPTKGQLISKFLFGVFNSPKQMNENNSTWGTIVVKSDFYVRFLRELKIPKRHFEINWPLFYLKL